MPELNGEMFKRFIIAFCSFIVFIFLLLAFYDLIVDSVVNSITGNIVWDSLIYIIPIAFGSGIVMIMYNNYIQKEGD